MLKRRLGKKDYARYRLAARRAGDEIYRNGDVRTEFRAAMYAADKEESRRKKTIVVGTGGLFALFLAAVVNLPVLF